MSAGTAEPSPMAGTTAETEVVDLCRHLIRLDTSNPTSDERKAAEWVATQLSDAGLEPKIYESEPGRASVIARIAGTDRGRPALLLHGHLDVVPARAEDWQVPPFAGEITDDGYLWGRGAIDMKDMDAMILAVVRQWHREGYVPPRDIVLAFLADEEAGGRMGARWLVENHPELFEGCSEAVSEVGGFSVTVADDKRLYLIETAEKGIAWMRLIARGRAGHGSMSNTDNAVTRIAQAVARLGGHRFPFVRTDTVEAFLGEAADALGMAYDPGDPDAVVEALGPISRMLGVTLRNTVNPTMLEAGYKCNVIPGDAVGTVDGRFLPGQETQFEAEVRELIGPDIEIDYIDRIHALETSFDGPLVAAMGEALRAEDPGARPVPYMLSGGTDGKHFATLGMRCFGFAPLKLPADLDFAALFHGVDERVPTEALSFGVRVLDRFLRSC